MENKVRRRILKGTHVELQTTNNSLMDEVRMILKVRYPEAVVNIEHRNEDKETGYYGRVTIIKNLFDRLTLSVWKDLDNNVSYAKLDFMGMSDSLGLFWHVLGLIPRFLIMLIQFFWADNFKKEVYRTLTRDFYYKYRYGVKYVEKPSLIMLILMGLIGLYSFYWLYLFFANWIVLLPYPNNACPINFFGSSGGNLIIDNINIFFLWVTFCLFIWHNHCKVKNFVYIIYITIILMTPWVMDISYFYHYKKIGETSIVSTIEQSYNALVWCTLFFIYLLFILSLIAFTKKCEKYDDSIETIEFG